MAEESVSLLLEKHLEMQNLQELAERFAAALAEAACVVLDGSVVSRIDGAGLQLLMAMVHTARQRGVEMAWRQPSATLREAAALLGLEAELDLPEEN
jgi:anti-anti-sigma regulatory factor